MPETECVCGADEPCTGRCERHDRLLHGYPCGACEAEWEASNPRTAKAIGDFAGGRGSVAKVTAARRADTAALAPPARPDAAVAAGGESDG